MQFSSPQELIGLVFQQIADIDELKKLAQLLADRKDCMLIINQLIDQACSLITNKSESGAIRLLHFCQIAIKFIGEQHLGQLQILISYDTACAYYSKRDFVSSIKILEKTLLKNQDIRNWQLYTCRRLYGLALIQNIVMGSYYGQQHQRAIVDMKKAVFSISEQFCQLKFACFKALEQRKKSTPPPDQINLYQQSLNEALNILTVLTRINIYEDLEKISQEKDLLTAKERLVAICTHYYSLEHDFRKIFQPKEGISCKPNASILSLRRPYNQQVSKFDPQSLTQLKPIYTGQFTDQQPAGLFLNKPNLILRGMTFSLCFYLISTQLHRKDCPKDQSSSSQNFKHEFDKVLKNKQLKKRKNYLPNQSNVAQLFLLKAVQVGVTLIGVEQRSPLISLYIDAYIRKFSSEALYLIEQQSNIDSTIQNIKPEEQQDKHLKEREELFKMPKIVQPAQLFVRKDNEIQLKTVPSKLIQNRFSPRKKSGLVSPIKAKPKERRQSPKVLTVMLKKKW